MLVGNPEQNAIAFKKTHTCVHETPFASRKETQSFFVHLIPGEYFRTIFRSVGRRIALNWRMWLYMTGSSQWSENYRLNALLSLNNPISAVLLVANPWHGVITLQLLLLSRFVSIAEWSELLALHISASRSAMTVWARLHTIFMHESLQFFVDMLT